MGFQIYECLPESDIAYRISWDRVGSTTFVVVRAVGPDKHLSIARCGALNLRQSDFCRAGAVGIASYSVLDRGVKLVAIDIEIGYRIAFVLPPGDED